MNLEAMIFIQPSTVTNFVIYKHICQVETCRRSYDLITDFNGK